jgi:hypothetical protein
MDRGNGGGRRRLGDDMGREITSVKRERMRMGMNRAMELTSETEPVLRIPASGPWSNIL